MKKLVVVLLCIMSTSCLAAETKFCADALPTNNPNFCPSFAASASCHCASKGVPSSMCQNMESLYKRMLSIFGSLERACAFQHDTDKQTCIDDWNCYRLGGKDSQGRLCSSSGNRCGA